MTVLGVTAIVPLVIAALALEVSGLFVRPVDQMVEGLKDIAQGEGDLTRRLTSSSKDDIGEMANRPPILIRRRAQFRAQL